MAQELIVPEVGESITEVQIGKWFKQEGDAVKKDEPVVEIETDKVTLELPAPADGKITRMDKKQGEEASVGDVIGMMEAGAAGEASGDGDSGGGASEEAKAPEVEHKSEPAAAASASADDQEATPADKGQTATPATERDSQQAVAPGSAPAPENATPGDSAKVMPAARRLLDENNLKAEQVDATGPGGRLLKEDVQRHLKSNGRSGEQAPASPPPSDAGPRREAKPDQAAASSSPAPTAAGSPAATQAATASAPDRAEEVVPMTPMRKSIAHRLVQAQQTGALLTTFNEINMAKVMAVRSRYKEAFQEKYDVKLGFMSFFVKAAVDALKEMPAVNGEVRGTDIVYKNYYDIGIAVGTGKGLVVPILRNAERMSFAEVEKTIGDFGKRAQNGKLTLDELQGGTFTITNGGVFGSLMSTPIVNPPQSAVLGMHTIQKRPIVDETTGQIVAAPMMYIALTYDHRLVDGREAVTFLRRVKETVEDPNRLLMEV